MRKLLVEFPESQIPCVFCIMEKKKKAKKKTVLIVLGVNLKD